MSFRLEVSSSHVNFRKFNRIKFFILFLRYYGLFDGVFEKDRINYQVEILGDFSRNLRDKISWILIGIN